MASSEFGNARGRSTMQRVTIVLLALFQLLVTLLPSVGLGEPIGDRSDGVRTAITPAGWAFSIWGVLYLGSLAYAVFQFLPAQRSNALLEKIGWASAGAFLGNGLWALYVQGAELNVISVCIIVFTLLRLLSCYRQFGRVRPPFARGEQFLVIAPLSGLAAWLTAATIVNIAAALKFHGVDFKETEPLLGALVVIAGGVIAGTAIWRGAGNPWYALVFVWALAGIYSASAGPSVAIASASVASGVLVLTIMSIQLSKPAVRRRWFSAPQNF
jgi:hypothetical protein